MSAAQDSGAVARHPEVRCVPPLFPCSKSHPTLSTSIGRGIMRCAGPVRGGRGGGRGAPQQHVRPLVPPASPPARATTTHRPADHEATDDAPPPSYEQASKTTPYVPPAGHPSHPGSSPGQSSTDPRASASSGFGRGGSGPPPGRGSNSSLRGRPAPGGVSVAPTSSAASESSSGRQDRDCIIM